jgi:hypothetical protein
MFSKQGYPVSSWKQVPEDGPEVQPGMFEQQLSPLHSAQLV